MEDSITLKRCAKCRQMLSATTEHFHVSRRNRDGLSNRCKVCGNAAQRERRINPLPPSSIPDGYKICTICSQLLPKTSEYFYTHGPKRLHSECKECMKAVKRKHPLDILPQGFKRCGTCKEIKPATREYFYPKKGKTINLESSCKVCRRAFFDRVVSPEKRLANSRHYEALPEYRETRRQYRSTHREESLIHSRNRCARVRNAIGSHTLQDIQDQYKRQKGKCYWCGAKLGKERRNYHVDHVVPLARGGSNDPSNLVIACPHCNTSRSARLPHEWVGSNRLL